MASPFSGRAGRLAGMWATDQAIQDFNAGNEIIDVSRTRALDALGRGRDQGIGALNAGYAAARPEYEGAIERFQPWVTAGQGALGTYQDSLGLNGAAGNDNAVAAFRTSPGYDFRVNEATDAVARKASALGALGSGNTMQAITDRASGLADQEYEGWQDRLGGLSSTGLSAAGQQAGIQTRLGQLGAQQGRDQAGIYTGTAGQESGVETNFSGMSLANLGKMSDTKISAGTGALMAGQTAAQNRLNFGMQGLQLGANLLGKFAGMG